jgi:hypothetical protein
MKFAYFRIILGTYLILHFISLISYAEELFGNAMPFDPTLSPTYDIFPNILNHIDATPFIIFLLVMSIMFTLGFSHRICSLFLWYGWAALLNRNVLIHNPGIPYVGWLLLACTFIPNNNEPNIQKDIFWFAWFLMGLGYTISGLHKLQCPSWIDGTALIHILNSPIARDNFIRDFVISLPPIFLKLNTWFSLGLEISFLPLGMFYHTRLLFWMTYMIFHVGILFLINFTDLTIGVMMIHFFTFDPQWLSWFKLNKLS